MGLISETREKPPVAFGLWRSGRDASKVSAVLLAARPEGAGSAKTEPRAAQMVKDAGKPAPGVQSSPHPLSYAGPVSPPKVHGPTDMNNITLKRTTMEIARFPSPPALPKGHTKELPAQGDLPAPSPSVWVTERAPELRPGPCQKGTGKKRT